MHRAAFEFSVFCTIFAMDSQAFLTSYNPFSESKKMNTYGKDRRIAD
jgi:hypothetical protein